MFKRRKPDDLTAPEAATLPAGLAEPASDKGIPQFRGLIINDALTDSGLGVPPFRPAPSKETSTMSRPPFMPPAPGPAPAPPAPSPAPLRATQPTPRASPRDASDRRTLVVGRGISLQGTVQDAERLVVEGTVEASMIHATELAIAQGGMVKGEVEVEEAEVSGTFNGTLTARGNLVIRGTGRVLGTARCRRLQVEDGGHISGQMEMLAESAKAEAPRATIVPEPAL